MSQVKTLSKEEQQAAYFQVFGAAIEANAKYKDKKDGVYAQQVRSGKTKRDNESKPKQVVEVKAPVKRGRK